MNQSPTSQSSASQSPAPNSPVTWTTLNLDSSGHSKIGVLLLDRPGTANAFSGAMMEAIPAILEKAAHDTSVRCVVIAGRGKHFCAGADLGWMQESARLSHEENLRDATRLTSMFESIANFPRPTMALVRGAAYGGAVGLVACCDIVIATDNSRFCLSEAKLGLVPAVIMPYLARRIAPGALRRAALTSRVIDANDARGMGLVDVVTGSATMDEVVRGELAMLAQAGPQAQRAAKNLLDQVREKSARQGEYTAQVIASARTGSEGQAGLNAFFSKAPPPWVVAIPDELKISQLLEHTDS